MKINGRALACFLIFAACLLLGAVGGIWLTRPVLLPRSLASTGWTARLFRLNWQYVVVSVMQGAAFVLAAYLCARLRAGMVLLGALALVRGALFGCSFSAALFYGSVPVCLCAALQNLLILAFCGKALAASLQSPQLR